MDPDAHPERPGAVPAQQDLPQQNLPQQDLPRRNLADAGLPREDYAAIARFRLELRRFLAFSEAAAGKVGLPAQQHQALLAIAGHDGPPTVGFVAEQLLIAPQTAAELVSRMVENGFVTKTAEARDRRRMALSLTPKAMAVLQRLTTAHLAELRTLEPALAQALARVRARPDAR